MNVGGIGVLVIDTWANLGTVDFYVNEHDGQNKFVFHISKMGITQSFFILIWRSTTTKGLAWLSSILAFWILVFLLHFLVQGLTGAPLGLWAQNHSQVVGTCPGHGPNA